MTKNMVLAFCVFSFCLAAPPASALFEKEHRKDICLRALHYSNVAGKAFLREDDAMWALIRASKEGKIKPSISEKVGQHEREAIAVSKRLQRWASIYADLNCEQHLNIK